MEQVDPLELVTVVELVFRQIVEGKVLISYFSIMDFTPIKGNY